MRSVIVLFFLVVQGTLCAKAQGVSRFKESLKSNESLQKAALYLALHQRCLRYFLPVDRNSIKTAIECERETKNFLIDLNIKVSSVEDPRDGHVAPATVVFHRELVELIGKTKTYMWLNEIESQLQMSGNIRFDLYASSYKVLKNDREVRRHIGVLLQDTSASKVHIAYLQAENLNSQIQKANLEKLNSVVDELIKLQKTKKWVRDFSLYPKSLERLHSKISQTQYHFYVLAWNSEKSLSTLRLKSASKIVFINTMFNFLYERYHSFKAIDALSDRRALSTKSAQDTLLGFYGALSPLGLHPQSVPIPDKWQQRPYLFFSSIVENLAERFP